MTHDTSPHDNISNVSHSAGGIILNNKGQVAVVNQDGVSWSLPKGHVESGESSLETAMREIAEETGITNLTFILTFEPYERFKIGKNGIGEERSEKKVITFHLFETTQEAFRPTDDRHPQVKWVNIDEVTTLLTHPKDQEFFESIKPQLNYQR